ncbi:Chemotaxis protein CheV [hydrothermal vent metagenome]|uniref:Chemotaxis protein CheV n=1 Tax=hydrothermal vent metagenome TaxID=652676 RepID=A0A3B0ZVA9_9ZZZZ
MTGILEGVDQRTNLVGENRLELLLFSLGGRQRFGINVFKVQEVIMCPPLTKITNSTPVVVGMTNMRGKTISVLDLALAIGKKPLQQSDTNYLIITEYNRQVQGFLTSGVDRIVNMNWSDIKAPPQGLGKDNYMTAVTSVDDELVEIIDVEKVLAELLGIDLSGVENAAEVKSKKDQAIRVLVVDDSSVARNQIKRTLDKLGMECTIGKNGLDGLNILKSLIKDGSDIADHIDVLISDVEMPEMDGYTLTSEIRANEALKKIPILLHTSLSGVFNQSMVAKVGADKFVPKFNAEELAAEVKDILQVKGIIP